MAVSSVKDKAVSVAAWKYWPSEIREDFNVTIVNDKVVHTKFKVCAKHSRANNEAAIKLTQYGHDDVSYLFDHFKTPLATAAINRRLDAR